LNQKPLKQEEIELSPGEYVIKIGKKRFVKLIVS